MLTEFLPVSLSLTLLTVFCCLLCLVNMWPWILNCRKENISHSGSTKVSLASLSPTAVSQINGYRFHFVPLTPAYRYSLHPDGLSLISPSPRWVIVCCCLRPRGVTTTFFFKWDREVIPLWSPRRHLFALDHALWGCYHGCFYFPPTVCRKNSETRPPDQPVISGRGGAVSISPLESCHHSIRLSLPHLALYSQLFTITSFCGASLTATVRQSRRSCPPQWDSRVVYGSLSLSFRIPNHK